MDRRLTVDERRAAGRQARADVPLDSHAEWTPRPDRHSPVAIIQSQNEHRVPWLLPWNGLCSRGQM